MFKNLNKIEIKKKNYELYKNIRLIILDENFLIV
jgi:hypothetical protein